MPTQETTTGSPQQSPMPPPPIRIVKSPGFGVTLLTATGASVLAALVTVVLLQPSVLPANLRVSLDRRVEGEPSRAALVHQEGTVKVPDVAGLPVLQAAERVGAIKLQLGGPLEAPSPSVPKGLAIATLPPAGTPVAAGGLVQLVVSSGPPVAELTVPKVTGLGRSRAVAALEQAGLKVGTISWVSSDDLDAGVVTRQDPAADAKVAPGAVVTLSVVRDD